VMKTSSRLIGMVQPYDAPGAAGKLHSIGCAGKLTAFSETEDGRYMVTLSGASRFRIVEEIEGFTPYRRCKVSWQGFSRDLGPVEKDENFDRDSFMKALNRFLVDQGLSTDWDSLSEAEDELLINSLSMLCPFTPEDKQALLEAPSLSTRRETLLTLMEYSLRGGNGEGVMQ